MDRRTAMKLGLVSAPIALSPSLNRLNNKSKIQESESKIKHSISRWCYSKIEINQLISWCKELGVSSIELLDKEEYDIVKAAGLDCAIVNGSSLGLEKGFCDQQYHAQLLEDYKQLIPQVAKDGLKTIITFSGNRAGVSDEQGLANCVMGLKPIVEMAAEYNIMIVMELLNSHVDHKDYMCDKTEWGVALVDALGLDNFRLLYDIYHMQIMEGNVVANIRKYHKYIAHYHTGGVPGRNEINDSQELNYPFIIRSIAETGYQGYIGQEFIPTAKNPYDSLKESIRICS